jgi:hypothetical protein
VCEVAPGVLFPEARELRHPGCQRRVRELLTQTLPGFVVLALFGDGADLVCSYFVTAGLAMASPRRPNGRRSRRTSVAIEHCPYIVPWRWRKGGVS